MHITPLSLFLSLPFLSVSLLSLSTKSKPKKTINVTYLHSKRPQNDGTEDGVGKYSVKDVSLSVDFASIDLVEKLHEDEGVEDDGVVLGGRGVEWGVAATVDVKHALTWRVKKKE